ncbi:MAG: PD-(D/E)XK nuclease family protein [Proteobacteria bacterium]|nr:PD-(D/E)XK nuclease family protein [Pseudomonadota bacterium]
MNPPQFVNKHLSYSRLSRFEQCPLSFKIHYIDKQVAEPGDPLKFGKAVHAVLERLVREHVDTERVAPLSEDRALELFRQAWTAEGMTGVELFQEGVEILRTFVLDQGELDHRDVLAIEKEFHLPLGRFTVLGFIDRVDCVDDETVEVIDYKTNRQLFTREEVEHSLQMSLYHLAALKLWPWAKKVRLTFHMLRHGLRMQTERTLEQLDTARLYVETLGEMTEKATEFPARLNANCIYCDHRRQCPAYADALKGKRELICQDTSDLEAVAREREEVARLAKVLYSRKGELEDVLKAHLQDHDELILGGVRYAMFKTTRLEYPLEPTLHILAGATGLTRDALVERLAAIDKDALEKLLKELGRTTNRAQVRLLKTELESVAHKSHSPRFWAKEVSA